MKPSPYNHFFPLPECRIYLAYNSFSGALGEIEEANFDRIQQLLANPGSASTEQDHQYVEVLKQGGFLIPDPVDQAATIQETAKRLRKVGSILGLTVVPTMACNFGCDYCFEARSSFRMPEATQDALLKFSDDYLRRAEGLRVWWFGGEPTICMNIVDRVQSQLLELAAKHGVEVMSGEIISNGYLLDAEMATHLRDLQITTAQITIDGPEEVHNRRRPLANGDGSFRRILDNLAQSADILEITVRINIDRENVESVYQVIDTLVERNILPKVKISFGHVTTWGAACADIRGRCFSDLDFSRTCVEIYRRLHERGVYIYEYPTLRIAGASCAALSEGYFTVGPDGHFYRCAEDMVSGPERSIGSVFNPNPADERQRETLESYRTWDPFKMQECPECKLLPACMGGCPAQSMQESNGRRGHCTPSKYNLGDLVALRYESETHSEPEA